jgi:diguanylate cyclase (GGDEF)-like protein
MTLYRQMSIFIFLLFVLLFTAASAIKLHSTRAFLEEQLYAHAQDTATSLGLSILPHIAEGDLATVETMLSAVFDRGYYEYIELADLDGKKLMGHRQPILIDSVPPWFVETIVLATPEATTLITSGWQRFGHLAVKSHPGYAYKTLWRSSVNITTAFTAIAGLALLAGALALRLLLHPLKEVERQAEDLCRRQYRLQTTLPRTRELRRVVVAMNAMTTKVRQMFSEQAKLAETFRQSAYSDPLTAIGNRRYLEGQVAAAMEGEKEDSHGALLLLALQNLTELNRRKGYQYSDQLLQDIAGILTERVKHLPRAALARISGGTFALFLPEISEDETRHIAAEIMGQLPMSPSKSPDQPDSLCHLGGVTYDRATPLRDLLSSADRMLAVADTEGINNWALATLPADSATMPRGEQQWLATLDKVLRQRNIVIFCQKTVAGDDLGRALHTELLARMITDDGQLLSAALFIPLAERLQRVAAIDRLIVEQGLQLRSAAIDGETVAINLSTSSLKDPTFVDWLMRTLREREKHAPPVVFEFTEFQATRELSLVHDFAVKVQALGHGIGLDHFGQSFVNFGYLSLLQPKHVKIDRAFTDELKSDQGNSRFFIGALTSVAHSLDILVIAEGVEDEKQYAILKELHIDGIQGYLVDKPRQLS